MAETEAALGKRLGNVMAGLVDMAEQEGMDTDPRTSLVGMLAEVVCGSARVQRLLANEVASLAASDTMGNLGTEALAGGDERPPLSPAALALLHDVRDMDGVEVPKEGWGALDELEAAGLCVSTTARGPGNAWRRALPKTRL